MSIPVIRVQNCYSWLQTDDKKIKSQLWDCLRFRDKNYFHSKAYKLKVWDGYNEFFKLETGRFLTGLLPEVETALKLWKCEYAISDERNVFKFNVNKINDQFLNTWKHLLPLAEAEKFEALRDYQVEITNLLIRHKRGIVFAPTSAGKTNILISALKCLPPNCPTLILANKKSLCDQNYDELNKWGLPNVGRLYDKAENPNIITVATIQSLHKIDKLIDKFKAIFVDEIHEMMSNGPQKVYAKMKSAVVRVGISATPFKFGGTDQTQKYLVKGHFGPVLRIENSSATENGILTTKKLQEAGTLSQCNCTFYKIKEPQLPYDIYQDAVTRGIAENWHFHNVVKKLVATLKGRTLILVDRLAHGDQLQDLIPGALWVRGQDNLKTRKEIIEKLKKAPGNVVCLATQQIFNTGLNVFIHNLINAASGQADHQIIQRFGRGLRTAEDKEILNYYDFVFDINPYLLEHSKKRIKILQKEGHEVNVKEEFNF